MILRVFILKEYFGTAECPYPRELNLFRKNWRRKKGVGYEAHQTLESM